MIPLLFIALFMTQAISNAAAPETFRFNLAAEPHSLDPQTTAGNSGNYVFHNIYRGLFRYHSRRGLIKEAPPTACAKN